LATSRAIVVFPLPGGPVIQIAQLIKPLCRWPPDHGRREPQQSDSHPVRDLGVPEGVGDDHCPEQIEGGKQFEEVAIPRLIEVYVEELHEEPVKGLGPVFSLEEAEEEVVDC